jgi:hypothetical protein
MAILPVKSSAVIVHIPDTNMYSGYSYHGDFIAGWDTGLLQNAVDQCTNPSGRIEDCPLFDLQTEEQAAQCLMDMPPELDEDDCEGPRQGLPGDVPIQSGPAYASPLKPGPGGPYTPPAPPASATPVISQSAVVPTLSYSAGTNYVTDSYGGGVTVAAVDMGATPAAPAPEVTPGANFAELPSNERIIGTSVFTSAGAVYEIVLVEEDVYVTADAPPARRHQHHARHGHHH